MLQGRKHLTLKNHEQLIKSISHKTCRSKPRQIMITSANFTMITPLKTHTTYNNARKFNLGLCTRLKRTMLILEIELYMCIKI